MSTLTVNTHTHTHTTSYPDCPLDYSATANDKMTIHHPHSQNVCIMCTMEQRSKSSTGIIGSWVSCWQLEYHSVVKTTVYKPRPITALTTVTHFIRQRLVLNSHTKHSTTWQINRGRDRQLAKLI